MAVGSAAGACRISGLSRILLNGPDPCLANIRLRARMANKTIRATPTIPSAIPMPAAAPRLNP